MVNMVVPCPHTFSHRSHNCYPYLESLLKNFYWKSLLKLSRRKENSVTPSEANAPISQTSSEDLKLTIQTYQMWSKELKMKFRQLQEETSKVFFPVSADLSNDFKNIILEIDQRKPYPSEVSFAGAVKISTFFYQ